MITKEDTIEITGRIYNGHTNELEAIEVNGERFIPETNATRNADHIAHLLRAFLEQEQHER